MGGPAALFRSVPPASPSVIPKESSIRLKSQRNPSMSGCMRSSSVRFAIALDQYRRGRFFDPQPRPELITLRHVGECFRNAFLTMSAAICNRTFADCLNFELVSWVRRLSNVTSDPQQTLLLDQAMTDSRLLMLAFFTRRHSGTFSRNQARIGGRRCAATTR